MGRWTVPEQRKEKEQGMEGLLGRRKGLKSRETVLGSEEGVRRKKIARDRKGCCLRMCSNGKSPQMLVILKKKKKDPGKVSGVRLSSLPLTIRYLFKACICK